MRWSAQQVLDDGVGSELALPGLRGLLRTVRVPEFAGVTFHEVEAKSALNRVPGGSPVPFRWTVNPYRGCGHACRRERRLIDLTISRGRGRFRGCLHRERRVHRSTP